jgi:DNA-binding PucR family transcriptional regulator
VVQGDNAAFRGVSYRADRRRWRAQITVRGNTIHLGYYGSAAVAAQAYDAAARQLLGTRAHLNFATPTVVAQQLIRTPRKSLVLQVKRQLEQLDLHALVEAGQLQSEELWLLLHLFLQQPRTSKAEAARTLGIHPNTVSRRVARVLQRLGLPS